MGRKPIPPDGIIERNSKPTSSGCVEWTGYINSCGYGVAYSVILYPKERRVGAHRVAWEIKHGSIPDGLFVLHKCNNPACVNVDHLRLGTHTDNMQDRVAAGRYLNGSKHFNSKLNEESVSKIYLDSRTDGELAKEFNIHRTVVLDIRNGKIWQHVTGGIPSPNKPRGPKTRRTK